MAIIGLFWYHNNPAHVILFETNQCLKCPLVFRSHAHLSHQFHTEIHIQHQINWLIYQWCIFFNLMNNISSIFNAHGKLLLPTKTTLHTKYHKKWANSARKWWIRLYVIIFWWLVSMPFHLISHSKCWSNWNHLHLLMLLLT